MITFRFAFEIPATGSNLASIHVMQCNECGALIQSYFGEIVHKNWHEDMEGLKRNSYIR